MADMTRKKITTDRSVAERVTRKIFALSDDIRYAAVYRNGNLESVSKPDLPGTSWWESDRYEEIIINTTLVTLLGQRGSLECGGMQYLVIQYGKFAQLVSPIQGGHVSVGFEPGSGYPRMLPGIMRLLKKEMLVAEPART